MTSYRPFLQGGIRQRLEERFPILTPSQRPKPKPTTAPKIPVVTPGTMKKPETETVPIKTFGSGLEKSSAVYGTVETSAQQMLESQVKAKLENTQHEKEIKAPILSYQGAGTEFGSTMGGMGLTDQDFVARIRQWENEQRALFPNEAAQVAKILPNATNTSPPIKMQNLRAAGER